MPRFCGQKGLRKPVVDPGLAGHTWSAESGTNWPKLPSTGAHWPDLPSIGDDLHNLAYTREEVKFCAMNRKTLKNQRVNVDGDKSLPPKLNTTAITLLDTLSGCNRPGLQASIKLQQAAY
jgi:hypothetical protein